MAETSLDTLKCDIGLLKENVFGPQPVCLQGTLLPLLCAHSCDRGILSTSSENVKQIVIGTFAD